MKGIHSGACCSLPSLLGWVQQLLAALPCLHGGWGNWEVCSQSSLWMFQQLPPPSGSYPKAYPSPGLLPHHPAALTNELLFVNPRPDRHSRPRGHTTLTQPQMLPAPTLPQGLSIPCTLGQQPLDFRLTKAAALQALLQQEGRGSGVSSPTAFYSALQSQTVPGFISWWKGHMGTPSPTEV